MQFISNGQKPKLIRSEMWSNQSQALFGITPMNTDINVGPQINVQCFSVTDESEKPKSMSIYLIINTQFKRIVENDSVPVEMFNSEIKLCRSFDLEGIFANAGNYDQLHEIGKGFEIEVLKHAQFTLYKELGSLNALPLNIYESLIFDPASICLNVTEQHVSLTPFIHYYQLLNIPRMNLMRMFAENTKCKTEMSFTTGSMNFFLTEIPTSKLVSEYLKLQTQVQDLYSTEVIDLHSKAEKAAQDLIKTVSYELTMNENNRSSHEHSLFKDFVHRNKFNTVLPSGQLTSDDEISKLLDQAAFTDMNFSLASKHIDALDHKYKQHFTDNLDLFKTILGHAKTAISNCCHVYTDRLGHKSNGS